MTKSHHGGEMSVMIKVGMCQCQIPTIHDKLQLQQLALVGCSTRPSAKTRHFNLNIMITRWKVEIFYLGDFRNYVVDNLSKAQTRTQNRSKFCSILQPTRFFHGSLLLAPSGALVVIMG